MFIKTKVQVYILQVGSDKEEKLEKLERNQELRNLGRKENRIQEVQGEFRKEVEFRKYKEYEERNQEKGRKELDHGQCEERVVLSSLGKKRKRNNKLYINHIPVFFGASPLGQVTAKLCFKIFCQIREFRFFI